MTISNIISAIGNNSSVYPLIVRDCGIEVPTKIALTYNQNKKESKGIAYLAARERFLDEYATSAVWLGGIPFVGWIANKYIKARGLNPDVNLKLFKEEQGIQGIDYNINKFKDLAPDAVKDLVKAKENKKLFEKLLAGKFIASTTIPILFMGFILPKLIFASSAKKIQNLREKEAQSLKNNAQVSFLQKDKFYKSKDVNFTGSWITKAANFSAQDKMAVTDGGYAVGRIATARNKNERYDLSFKMAGMMFLNFVAPKWIEKGLNKISGISLDPVMLADKDFMTQIKEGKLQLPKTDSAKDLLDFVDNIQNKDTYFIKYAKKFEKIKMLENGIRDPREYVDLKKLGNFRNDIELFSQKLLKSENIDSFIKKAKFAKSANILTNVALSSFLLAYVLPKAQFAFRKLVTGSDLEPGLAPAEKIVDKKA
ncbi:unknown [Clostridium sp. CAG:768]|nr:unknown [Clostridium sp. CAG:768]